MADVLAACDWLAMASGGWRRVRPQAYPPTGSSAQLLLQRLGSDDPATEVRAHIDLGADDIAAEAARWLGLALSDSGPAVVGSCSVIRSGWCFCVSSNSPDDP